MPYRNRSVFGLVGTHTAETAVHLKICDCANWALVVGLVINESLGPATAPHSRSLLKFQSCAFAGEGGRQHIVFVALIGGLSEDVSAYIPIRRRACATIALFG